MIRRYPAPKRPAGSPALKSGDVLAHYEVGEKIGETKFHLSCSDDDMDGPEDFGKPAGNGKDSDEAYLNSWTFRGMVAAGQSLVCGGPD